MKDKITIKELAFCQISIESLRRFAFGTNGKLKPFTFKGIVEQFREWRKYHK